MQSHSLRSAPSGRATSHPAFASIASAVEVIAAGGMVIVVDDADRENEGDVVIAAEHATPEAINFMATEARGLICCALETDQLRRLQIPPMTDNNTDPHQTAFHVSIDHASLTSTGISARDRAATIRALASPNSAASDFSRPGHVFPLAARSGGVEERNGHTEASVALARLAGCTPAAAICEVARTDGEMARLPDLLVFARRHQLLVVSIADLVDHIPATPKTKLRVAPHALRRPGVERVAEAEMPLDAGDFRVIGFRDVLDGGEHLALVFGDLSATDNPLARLHSECLTGDALGSRRCDCGRQLALSLERIREEGAGVLVYLRGHEGRGIGLIEKIRAYALQDGGRDTVEANLELGHPADARSYRVGADILAALGIKGVRLLTNNLEKVRQLESFGVTVVERRSLVAPSRPESRQYLETKRLHLGHVT